MKHPYKCLFSYYGGKSKLAHLYPAPLYYWIIEPFAGGAAYSLLHGLDRPVFLNELNPRVWEIWRFLLRPDALELAQLYVPRTVEAGDVMDREHISPSCPDGLLYLMQSEANHGTQGAVGIHKQVTKFGAKGWPRLLPRLEYWIPRIRHWVLLPRQSYLDLPNAYATWFVDPPYSTPAGLRYAEHGIDYAQLAEWCRSRHGQVIACGDVSETWLEFKPLAERRGVRSSYQQSRMIEGVWHRGDYP